MAAKLNKITIYITSTEAFFNRDADGNSVFDEKLYKKALFLRNKARQAGFSGVQYVCLKI